MCKDYIIGRGALFLYIVGAFIICWNPLQDINQRDFVQSVVLMFGGVDQN